MRFRLGMVFLLVFALTAQTFAQTRQEMAAVVEVTFGDVEVNRSSATNWLPLAVGAQAPFGIGDTIRTGQTGRALLTFAGAAQTLLLPESEYQLQRFEAADSQLRLSLRLIEGRSIQQITDAPLLDDYQLILPHMTLTQPVGLFATQVQTGTYSDVIVAQGTLQVEKDGQTLQLDAGTGIRAAESLGEVITITPPQGFSFLAVTSNTCRALVNATIPGETSVSVRLGPGEDYYNLGNIPNGSEVAILGKADVGGRLLTPFLSTFGWLIPNGVVLKSCDELPLIPAEAQIIYGVINPASFEMDLLVPFFGTPTQNSRFYSYE